MCPAMRDHLNTLSHTLLDGVTRRITKNDIVEDYRREIHNRLSEKNPNTVSKI